MYDDTFVCAFELNGISRPAALSISTFKAESGSAISNRVHKIISGQRHNDVLQVFIFVFIFHFSDVINNIKISSNYLSNDIVGY